MNKLEEFLQEARHYQWIEYANIIYDYDPLNHVKTRKFEISAILHYTKDTDIKQFLFLVKNQFNIDVEVTFKYNAHEASIIKASAQPEHDNFCPCKPPLQQLGVPGEPCGNCDKEVKG